MAADYRKIMENPKYRELVRRRSSLGWTLTWVILAIYFGFILLIAYAPAVLGTPIGAGVTTVGVPVGLVVIISAFLLTGVYVRKANAEYDSLTREIVEESK